MAKGSVKEAKKNGGGDPELPPVAVETVETESPLTARELYRLQYDFAVHAYHDTQELIRFMDQKASFLVASVGILSAAISSIAFKAFDIKPGSGWSFCIYLITATSLVSYMIVAIVAIAHAVHACQVTSGRRKQHTASNNRARGLIYAQDIIDHCEDGGVDCYAAQLQAAQPQHLLHEYANSLYVIAKILVDKQHHVNVAIRLFYWLVAFWASSIIGSILLIILTHKG